MSYKNVQPRQQVDYDSVAVNIPALGGSNSLSKAANQISPQDKKFADEVVLKSLAMSEMATKNKITDQETMAQAMQSFNFSERVTNHIAEHGIPKELQFADPLNPVIGNNTFGTLNMVSQEIGSNMSKDCLLSLAFPDKIVQDYQVMLDRMSPNSGMLPEYNADAVIPTIRKLDTYGVTYEAGLWLGRTSLNALEMTFKRQIGGGSFDVRGLGQLVAYNTVNGVTQAFTRKKYLLNQAVFFNGYTYGGTNISFNIPANNFVGMKSMGTLQTDGSVIYDVTDPTYNPIQNIMNLVNNPIFLLYRSYFVGIILNPADLQAMLNHPNVKAVTNLWSAATTSLANRALTIQMNGIVKEITAYYAPSFNIPFLADDGVWLAQNADGTRATDATQPKPPVPVVGSLGGAAQFFVPRGRMYILMDTTRSPANLVTGGFHLTLNQADPNIEAPVAGLYTGVFNRNLNNADTINRLDIVTGLAGAPALYAPETQFVITGLYSNVTSLMLQGGDVLTFQTAKKAA